MEIHPHKAFINHQLLKQRQGVPSLYRQALNVVVQNPSLDASILPKHVRKQVQTGRRYQEMQQESKKYWKK